MGTRVGKGIERPKFRFPRKQETARIRVLSDYERDEIIRLFRDRFDDFAKRNSSDGFPAGPSWSAYFAFLMDTGLRPSEARALRAADRYGDRLRVWKTKSGKPRILPLTPRAEEAFERQALRCENSLDEPFCWATKDRVSWVWKWLRRSMGHDDDPEFIPYILRHDCATRLYAKTSDLLLVKEWMGHSSIEMTLRYAKLDPGRLAEARDLLAGAADRRHVRPV
ncbi:tyrosine-type recombinase/integrase [Glycocaulis sp.]|uniref:tyrosine-type recombinase/integrase n=1 Tax=Glycocaulis sp. TaxID=1969725 RepID=UPI00345C5358